MEDVDNRAYYEYGRVKVSARWFYDDDAVLRRKLDEVTVEFTCVDSDTGNTALSPEEADWLGHTLLSITRRER